MTEQTLQLTGTVYVAKDADQLYDDLASALMVAAFGAVGARQAFHLALSGGEAPDPFYRRLVTDPRFRAIPWEMTHVWIVDERRVPEDDAYSNIRMIRESLLDHVGMRKRQIHPIPALLKDPVRSYEGELRRVLLGDPAKPAAPATEPAAPGGPSGPAAPEPPATAPSAPTEPAVALAPAPVAAAVPTADGRPTPKSRRARSSPVTTPRLDFVLLGMGEDGHTASLFPHSPALGERTHWVAINEGTNVTPPPRVTMTYPLLNGARQIAILATGERKAGTLRRVELQLRQSGANPDLLPITAIRPVDGELTWYLDAEAAGQ